ncbi:hypothetical protein EYF80_002965 [Liparis tanakae]|uniref:Uncharacterized protein n=1 Tax=Liparis tanakae TaxID=230148 RepID=A0A4Z2JBT9_9TELE|nr:hypothetical protein EYF80_002965 [Liparis tanakae]
MCCHIPKVQVTVVLQKRKICTVRHFDKESRREMRTATMSGLSITRREAEAEDRLVTGRQLLDHPAVAETDNMSATAAASTNAVKRVLT